MASWAPGPLTDQNTLSRDELAGIREGLVSIGVRPMPFPFSSAMAILSDCDGANRARYQGYVDAFVERGLDFGDSAWLHWDFKTGVGQARGLGFFSYTYSKGDEHTAPFLRHTRTFAQSVADFHLGHIDHLHSLSRDGPRVVVIESPVASGARVEIAAPPLEKGGTWDGDDLHLFGLLVRGECDAATLVEADGTLIDRLERAPPGQAPGTVFVLPCRPGEVNAIPLMRCIRGIRLSNAREVSHVVLLSADTDLMLRAVEELRRFNVELNLITEHARRHFRNPSVADADDLKTRERVGNRAGPSPAICGAVSDERGLIVSTDADDPLSICRVLPELFDMGLRFLVPIASHWHRGHDVLEMVTPTPTRSGGGGYWARRTLPLGAQLGATRHDTFAARLIGALEGAARRPGRAWPIYTHLGAVTPSSGAPYLAAPPDPYFEPEAMERLQDAALGLSADAHRMWFTRGSGLYDYGLILRSIAQHVSRRGDEIEIGSWRDEALGRTLPCSAAQLYGLTLYVDDAATASARLDGAPIETLARNRADETGRQSVTILESEIRATIFERLDPLEHGDAEIAGEAAWRDDALVVRGAATLALHGWRAPGAQAFAFDAAGTFGVRLRTQGGAAFYFGDPRWAEPSDVASYAFLKTTAGRFVVPFHDLAWRVADGHHVPSHGLASISFLGEASFARPTFLRPRATTLTRAGFCVAGRVPGGKAGQTVALGDRVARLDHRGWFCFEQVAPGVYRLACEGRCDRRGPIVEICADTVNLVLDRDLAES